MADQEGHNAGKEFKRSSIQGKTALIFTWIIVLGTLSGGTQLAFHKAIHLVKVTSNVAGIQGDSAGKD